MRSPAPTGMTILRRLLVTGGSGLVGGNLCFLALDRWKVFGTYRSNRPLLPGIDWLSMELTDSESVRHALSQAKPDVVVHTAAMADIDACEAQPELAWRTNVLGTRNVSEAAACEGARLIHISTSNVFDGRRGNYAESDTAHAINEYARTKIAGEAAAVSHPDSVVVRTSIVLGFPRTDGRSFLAKTVNSLNRGEKVSLPTKEIRSPVDVGTLSSCILELADSDHRGVFHIAGTEFLSRYVMGLKIASRLGCDPSLIVPIENPPPKRAPRPRDVSLNTGKARSILKADLPDCGEAIERAFRLSEERGAPRI